MPAKLYWLPLSPPARTVYFFAVAAGIEVELVHVDLQKGEHKQPEYLAINPNGQVPCLVDNDGFRVFESAAIMRYLSKKHSTDLLPSNNIQASTNIDQYAELVRSKLGPCAGGFVYQKAFAKKIFGKEPDPVAIANYEQQLGLAFKHLEGSLFEKSPNFAREGHLTLVDIILGIYLSQLSIVKFDLTPYPKTHLYFENLKQHPAYITSHKDFYSSLVKYSI